MAYQDYKKEDKHLLDQGCVVIDFSAQWCGPCKRMEPIFKKISEAFQDQVRFFKVDIDEHIDLATQHHISSIPSFLFLHNGKVIQTHTGSLSEADLKSLVEALIQAP